MARPRYRTGDPRLDALLAEVVEAAGRQDDADLVFESLVSVVRLARESAHRGDLKLVNTTLKELRYAERVFEPYRGTRKASIFGSARLAEGSPAFDLARDVGRAMADAGWMVITGAGPGIMAAGIEGAGRANAFGVNIVLPFESEAAEHIRDDPKLINFRYFFTRKLSFLRESHGFCLFPGGFGTMDEAFELLTLMQTGRAPIVPVVLMEPEGSSFWESWRRFVDDELVGRGLVSPADLGLVRICTSPADARDELVGFYRRYHSQRYVGRRLVFRLQTDVSDDELAALDVEFGDILAGGGFERVEPGPSEADDHPELARLGFRFDRTHFSRLRALIDRLNDRAPGPEGQSSPAAPPR